jgi:hypothetical protein
MPFLIEYKGWDGQTRVRKDDVGPAASVFEATLVRFIYKRIRW